MDINKIIAGITHKVGAPAVVLASRLAFAGLFTALISVHIFHTLPFVVERIPIVWTAYLIVLYFGCEKIYATFRKQNVDLSFAFPLLLSVFGLNITSLLVRGQETVPVINRAEHFATFVLFAYIVWIFFLKYLPQKVWREHPYYTAFLTLAITALAGVGNEIIELFLDQTFNAGTIGDRFDTSVDLLMNTLGAGTFLSVQLILREGKITLLK